MSIQIGDYYYVRNKYKHIFYLKRVRDIIDNNSVLLTDGTIVNKNNISKQKANKFSKNYILI